MATAQALRGGRPLWAGLRRGNILWSSSQQIRATAHATAVQSDWRGTQDVSQDLPHTAARDDIGEDAGSLALAPWYTVRGALRHRPLRDCAYYMSLLHYPKKEEYKDLPAEFFDHPPSTGTIATAMGQLRAQDLITESRELLKDSERLVWRHNLICHLGSNRVQIAGEGLTPEASYAAAFMGIMHQLHGLGQLRQLLEQISLISAPKQDLQTPEWTSKDATAKLHVHNFAARFLQTPDLEIRKEGTRRFKATVTIPTTKYSCMTSSYDEWEAELTAYTLLKKEIEHDFTKENQTIVMQDNSFVNLDNCDQILNLHNLKKSHGKHQPLSVVLWGPQSEKRKALRLFWNKDALSDVHYMPRLSDAKQLVTLEAAVQCVRQDPSLLADFEQSQESQESETMPKLTTSTFVSMDAEVVATLESCVTAADDLDLRSFQHENYQHGYHPRLGDARRGRGVKSDERYSGFAQSLASRSNELKLQQDMDRINPQLVEAAAARARLPIYQHKPQILAMVKNHDQCIIVGSTGSGKSTQVPQIILDDAIAEGRGALCNVFCIQPRRLACVSLALTVCNERGAELGDGVGYLIGGEYHNVEERGGSITYATIDTLSNYLERSGEELPYNISHIVVDEIHEHSTQLDRLLSLIKMTFSRRLDSGLRVPKLVLMSATLESDVFERYFEKVSQDGTIIRPPYLNVPGRVYQTTTNFLESFGHQLAPAVYHAAPRSIQQPIIWESAKEEAENELGLSRTVNVVAATIVHIVQSTQRGSILAFVPGAAEIRAVRQVLLNHKSINFADASQFQILQLHRLNPSDLAEALGECPETTRRIMISTNIAETSITLPNVAFVVDSGSRRVTTDIKVGSLQLLQDGRISRASVLQRAGRTGRTGPGQYYGTFTTQNMQELDAFSTPGAIGARELQELILRAKVNFPNVSIETFFNDFFTPVAPEKIREAKKYLRYLGALNDNDEITLIGYFLYRTTLCPSLARMVLLGILFRCVDQAIVLAVILGFKAQVFNINLFDDAPSPNILNKLAAMAPFAKDSAGDIIAELRIYEEYQSIRFQNPSAAEEWARKHHMAFEYLGELETRISVVRKVLHRAQFLGPRGMEDINAESNNTTLLRMIICAGLYPNVAVHHMNKDFVTQGALVVKPAVLSSVHLDNQAGPTSYTSKKKEMTGIFCYKNLHVNEHGDQYIGRLTPISPLMLALFSGDVKLHPDGGHNELLIDGSISLKFSGELRSASVFLEFKKVFDLALLTGLQHICEIWPSDKEKSFSTRLSDIILRTVEELVAIEEGQAKRRAADDIGSFSLEPIAESWDDQDHVARSWTPVQATTTEVHDCAERDITPSSGHSLPKASKPMSDDWSAGDDDETTVQAWNPKAFDEDDHGLSELPSEIDHNN